MRQAANIWWSHLTYLQKWEYIVKHKEEILGYPDRAPETLTGREIEIIYTKEH